MPPYEEWWYHTDVFSLQDLIDASQGKDPKEIIISIHRDRQVTDLGVRVEHRSAPDLKAWREGKAAEEKEYQKKLEAYKIEKLEYEEWKASQEVAQKQKEIRDLKEKLKKLKK